MMLPPHELHFLEMTALQMVKPIFSAISYREYLFSYTIITIKLLIFDNLVGKNVYFSNPPK